MNQVLCYCVCALLQVSILGVFVLTRQESVDNVIVSAEQPANPMHWGEPPSQTCAQLCSCTSLPGCLQH